MMCPLIDEKTEKFTRGQYEGSTIQEVADSGDEGIGYLYYVFRYSNTDEESKDFVENWLDDHPEYIMEDE